MFVTYQLGQLLRPYTLPVHNFFFHSIHPTFFFIVLMLWRTVAYALSMFPRNFLGLLRLLSYRSKIYPVMCTEIARPTGYHSHPA